MSAEPILPRRTALNEPFWEGCDQGELRIQACDACGHLRWPIAPVCPDCLDPGYTWRPLSGAGEIFSYAVVHQGYHPFWKERLPYAVALVELAEGPRLFSDIVDADLQALAVGRPVQVTFDDLGIPRFRMSA